jgi:uncharacterized membrane protein YcaP (DUF421 family)
MDAVLRGAAIYLLLLIIMRLSGRRTLAQASPFDFVLMLIIAETTQQALLGDDFSITNAMMECSTLVVIDVGLTYCKRLSRRFDRLIDGTPTLLIVDGVIDHAALRRARIDIDDIMVAARNKHGIDDLAQVRHAILESDSGISVIPVARCERPSPAATV